MKYKNTTNKVMFIKVGGKFLNIQPGATIELLQGNADLKRKGLVKLEGKDEAIIPEDTFVILSPDELKKMTKDQLNDYGVLLDVDINGSWSKSKMIEKLIEGSQ